MANWAQATADRIADAGFLAKGKLLVDGRHVRRLTPGDMRLDIPFGWS
jgi:hypothetical protein